MNVEGGFNDAFCCFLGLYSRMLGGLYPSRRLFLLDIERRKPGSVGIRWCPFCKPGRTYASDRIFRRHFSERHYLYAHGFRCTVPNCNFSHGVSFTVHRGVQDAHVRGTVDKAQEHAYLYLKVLMGTKERFLSQGLLDLSKPLLLTDEERNPGVIDVTNEGQKADGVNIFIILCKCSLFVNFSSCPGPPNSGRMA